MPTTKQGFRRCLRRKGNVAKPDQFYLDWSSSLLRDVVFVSRDELSRVAEKLRVFEGRIRSETQASRAYKSGRQGWVRIPQGGSLPVPQEKIDLAAPPAVPGGDWSYALGVRWHKDHSYGNYTHWRIHAPPKPPEDL